MTEAATQQDASRPASRERSTIKFPYEDLSSAEDVVRAVHGRYGGRAGYDQIAAELRASPLSGAFRNKVSAARTFGFVMVDRQGVATPTPLGMKLLDERTASDAKAQGFLNVPLYAQLYEDFPGVTLPDDKGLENAMRGLGVASKQVTTARQVFQRSAQQAGFFHQGRNRLVKPPQAIVTGSGYAEEQRTDERQEEGQPGMQADPLLASLFQKLPPSSQGFPESQRKNFVTALEAIFTIVYGPDDEERKDRRTGPQPAGAGREPAESASADATRREASASGAAPGSAELRAS
jgi:hypothetical protein